MSTDAVKAILKRKKDYLLRLESTIQEHKKIVAEAKKRMREDLPSDDESPQAKQQKQPKGSEPSSKQRRRDARRRSVEEEIVAPKVTSHGIKNPPPPPFFCTGINQRLVECDFMEKEPVTISQIISTNISTLKPRKMRLVCRVRSFHPQSIADFAAAWCVLCQQTYLLPKYRANELGGD